MKKRTISIILAAMMVISSVTPVGADTVDIISAYDEDIIISSEITTDDKTDRTVMLKDGESTVTDTVIINDETGADDAVITQLDNNAEDIIVSGNKVYPDDENVIVLDDEDEYRTDEALSREGEGEEEGFVFKPGYHELPNAPEVERVDLKIPATAGGYTATELSQQKRSFSQLPSKYTTPNLPSLRDQNPYGTCWAHSSIALAELSLIKRGFNTSSIDLSELQLAYFTYNSVVDPLGGTEDDENSLGYGDPGFGEDALLDNGGNLDFSSNVLASWTGAADEATVPYSWAKSGLQLDDKYAYSYDAAHLTHIFKSPLNTDNDMDINDLIPVKKLIYDNGAVGISYCSDSYYYSSTYNSFYTPSYRGTNHAVTVVGWDDNFSRNKFKYEAPGDGAWLVRNSWTTGNTNSYFGYFWISYYDKSMNGTVYSFEFAPGDNYDNNYQYDGAMLDGNYYVSKGANVFTAHASGDGGSEIIKAASFDTLNANVNYQIDIYLDPLNGNPESGTKAGTEKGTTSYVGYYTVPLKEDITVPAGHTFSVVVTLSKNGEVPCIAAEDSYAYDWFTSRASANAGQSYNYSNSRWIDFGSKNNVNLRIKAFTDNEQSVPVQEQVSVPVASVGDSSSDEAVEVPKGTRVTFTCDTGGAYIYYTLDGEEPSFAQDGTLAENTRLYNNGIVINEPVTVKAVAIKEGMDNSDVVTYKYKLMQDWGDIPDIKYVRNLFKGNGSELDLLNVPDGVWYLFRNREDEYTMMTASGDLVGFKRTYTGKAINIGADIQVYYGNRRLWENRDYTISYTANTAAAGYDKTNAKNARTGPKVIIKGMGNYESSAGFYFTISQADISGAQIVSEKIVTTVQGKKLGDIKPAVKWKGTKLTQNKDYDLKYYTNGTEISAASLKNYKTVAGEEYLIKISAHDGGNYFGEMTDKVTVKTVDPKKVIQMSSVTVKIPKQDWSEGGISAKKLFEGEQPEATVTATINRKKVLLKYGNDFTVDDEEFPDAGTYNVTIRGTAKQYNEGESGNTFVGSKTTAFTINGIPANKVSAACLNTTVEYNNGKLFGLSDMFKEDAKFKYIDDRVSGFDPWADNIEKKSATKPELYVVTSKTKTEKVGSKSVKKTVKWNHLLKEHEDYEVEFINSGAKGKISLVFKLKGQYNGEIKKTVTVKPYDLKKDGRGVLGITVNPVRYSKSGAKPVVAVMYDGARLTEGIDYKLSYRNNAKVAAEDAKNPPTVTVTGMGNYTGSRSESFEVTGSDPSVLKLTVNDVVFVNKPGKFKVTPSITEGGTKLTIGKNKDIEPLAKDPYRYYYASTGKKIGDKETVPAGTEIMVKVGVDFSEKSPYYNGTGSTILTGYYRVIESGKDISKASAKVTKTLYYSNGKDLAPVDSDDIKVWFGSGKKEIVLNSKDYEVISITDNRFLGNATITIKGRGKYGGTKTFKCRIYKRKL